MNDIPLEILLATFNGEKYLAEQLDSILQQTYQNFRILIRDDGSQDKTLKIIQSYLTKHPDKITFIPSQKSSNGPINNFSKLIETSKAPYLMLCDQDDIWMPNKIKLFLDKMHRMEGRFTNTTPLLIHSDLSVVNEKLEEINPSFFNFQALNTNRISFGNLLSQNVITGCATMINRPLADLSIPIPEQSLMHDWWIALVASAFGKVDVIKKPTVLYRQHPNNTLGAKEFSFNYLYLLSKIKKVFSYTRNNSIFCDNLEQAQAFHDRFAIQLSRRKLIALDYFINLENENFLKRRYILIRYGFLKGKLAQNIGLLLRI